MWPFPRRSLEDVSLELGLDKLKRLSKILLVDDKPETFPLQLLRDEGYSIDHWEKVKDLRPLEEGQYDLIILDIVGVAEEWSQEDGLGVLEHIKQRNPSQVVIAFSGEEFKLSKQKFFLLADDVLWKPIDAVKCKQVIDGMLRTRFTIPYIWGGVQAILREQGLGAGQIKKLESGVLRAIDSGTNPATQDWIGPLLSKSQKAAQVVAAISTIAKLAGVAGA